MNDTQASTHNDGKQTALFERLAESTLLKGLLIFIFALVVISFSLTPLRSTNDAWWHLKSGKIIWESGFDLPEFDVFTWTGETTPWHNHEWLGQVTFWGVWLFAENVLGRDGLAGLIAFKAFILLGTFLILLAMMKRQSGSLYWALLVGLVILAISRRTFYPRPPIFSYLMMAVYIFLLVRARGFDLIFESDPDEALLKRRRKIALISLPILMIIWANLHGGFMIGIVIIGLFGAGEGLMWLWWKWGTTLTGRKSNDERAAEHFKYGLWTALLLTLCLIGSLCTPYGYHLYLLPGTVMSNLRLVRSIGELHSPDFFFTKSFEFALLATPVLLAIIQRKTPPIFFLFLYLFFGHQAIQHVRHLPVFAITAAPLMGWAGGALTIEIDEKFRAKVCLALGLAFIVMAGWQTGHSREGQSFLERNGEFLSGVSYYEQNYPRHACDFIILNDFEGRMYNPINNAGYFIWRLSPEFHKIFTDSRFDIWGDSYIWDADAIKDGSISEKIVDGKWVRTPWWELLDEYDINFIVINGDAGLNAALSDVGGWTLVYSGRAINNARRERLGSLAAEVGDDNIWVRDIPENDALIKRAQNSFENLIRTAHSAPLPPQ